MIGLPEIGDKVKVWPVPGRLVQDGPRPVDAMGGGRWLTQGREIVWSEFHLEQYRAGDLLLHEPGDQNTGNAPAKAAPAADGNVATPTSSDLEATADKE
jgi:hypothetical protein